MITFLYREIAKPSKNLVVLLCTFYNTFLQSSDENFAQYANFSSIAS